MPNGLKLKAESTEDLQVISSVLQDAILRIGEIRYDRSRQCVALVGTSRTRRVFGLSSPLRSKLDLEGTLSGAQYKAGFSLGPVAGLGLFRS